MLTTQCGPVGASRIFPCLDRPDRKASVALTLATAPDVDAISNMPVEREARSGGRVLRTFAPTPPMPVYLFYLGVGRFGWRKDAGGRGRVGVATPRGREEEGRFALEEGQRILAGFEEYFGIPYPLPKLDLVSIPEHAWGAMENWGAIAFREMRLLVSAHTSGRQQRDTLATITHEIAHQWFGNLVTNRGWTDIWLNESFASLMELVLVDRLHPEHRMVEDFLLTWTGPARLGDSLRSTHPVVTVIQRPEEIDEAFDEISYGKGASVLRMLEGFLGASAFRAGVIRYLDRFQYGNADSRDLWDSLGTVSGRPVREMLGAWVDRPGYPVVHAHVVEGGVELRQERFGSSPGGEAADSWPIPLRYQANGRTETRLWEGPTLRLPEHPPILLNPEARGFYRVDYDDRLFESLLARPEGLSESDRWAILDDLAAFTLVSAHPPTRLLQLADRWRTDSGFLSVYTLASELSGLSAYAGNVGRIADAAREFLSAQWGRLGDRPKTGESETDGILRERVASALLYLDAGFARKLAAEFEEFGRVPPDLRGPVAAAFGRVGGAAGHERILAALKGEVEEGVRLQLEFALVASTDPAEVARALELLDGTILNRAHAAQIVRLAAFAPEGRGPTWSWIRTHLADFDEAHPGTYVAGLVLQHAIPLVGIGRVEDVRTFLNETPFPRAARGAAKGLALLEITDGFAQRERAQGRGR